VSSISVDDLHTCERSKSGVIKRISQPNGLLTRTQRATFSPFQSCKHAARLLRDGWSFSRLAAPRELYLDTRGGRPLSREEEAHAATLPDTPAPTGPKR
jgi:hypothetical protein